MTVASRVQNESSFGAMRVARCERTGDGCNQIGGHALTAAYKGAHNDKTVEIGLGVLTAAIADVGVAGGASVSLPWQQGDCAVGPSE